ncbi:MAG: ATP-binding cassette domain-containing protein [Ilumatobacteraceae bacterium]
MTAAPPAIVARTSRSDMAVAPSSTGSRSRCRPGGCVCLIGTNSSGKSTLLKTLAGLIPAVAGGVEVAGAAPGTQPARVGYLAQRPASSFTLPIRAADVVSMGRFASLGLWRRATSADRAWCEDAIDRMGVRPFADRPLLELSGGQQQRTHLAQALAPSRRVVARQAHRRARSQRSQRPSPRRSLPNVPAARPSAMATHDLGDADGADVVVLLAGRVVAIGHPSEVLTDDHLRASFGFTGPH